MSYIWQNLIVDNLWAVGLVIGFIVFALWTEKAGLLDSSNRDNRDMWLFVGLLIFAILIGMGLI